jgi:hypothetical protein
MRGRAPGQDGRSIRGGVRFLDVSSWVVEFAWRGCSCPALLGEASGAPEARCGRSLNSFGNHLVALLATAAGRGPKPLIKRPDGGLGFAVNR